MILSELYNPAVNWQVAQKEIAANLPSAVHITKDRQIEAKAGAAEGLDFLAAFGYDQNKLDSMMPESNENRDDDEEDYYGDEVDDEAWWNACEQAFGDIVTRLFKSMPDGWTITNSICSFERDSYCPYVSISVGPDSTRKSRSTQTVWYHVTLSKNLPSIQRHGLTPNSKVRPNMNGYNNRTFLMSASAAKDSAKLRDIAQNLQSEAPTSFGGGFTPPSEFQPVALLKVTLPSAMTKRLDPSAAKVGGIYVTDPIPPTNIDIVYNGPVNSIKV